MRHVLVHAVWIGADVKDSCLNVFNVEITPPLLTRAWIRPPRPLAPGHDMVITPSLRPVSLSEALRLKETDLGRVSQSLVD